MSERWPFRRPMLELTEEDLVTDLRGKPEGWYLEYKGDWPGDGIEKSVAAFANARGGWLFLGIAADKTTNEPFLDPIAGVDEGHHTIDSIRQTIADNLSPMPDMRVARVEVGEAGKVVFVVAVEEGAEPPYIHTGNGRLYIRRPGISKPADFVKDRAELDRLYDRAERHRQRLDDLLSADGHEEALVRYHKAALRGLGGLVDRQFTLLVVPTSAREGRFDVRWSADGQILIDILFAVVQGPPGLRGLQEWQHGTLFGPEDLTRSFLPGLTVVACQNKHGILGLSLRGYPRAEVQGPLRTAARNGLLAALHCYWRHAYDARVRLEAAAREGEALKRCVRRVQLPPVGSDGAEGWASEQTDEILGELQRALEFEERLIG